MSVFRFIRRIAEGEPIVVFGDGSQSRDFTFVDDIARGTDRRAPAAGLRSHQPRRRPGGAAVGGHRRDRPTARQEAARSNIARSIRPTFPARGPTCRRPPGCSAGGPRSRIEEGLRRSVEWYFANRDLARSLELCDRDGSDAE